MLIRNKIYPKPSILFLNYLKIRMYINKICKKYIKYSVINVQKDTRSAICFAIKIVLLFIEKEKFEEEKIKYKDIFFIIFIFLFYSYILFLLDSY